MIEIRFHGRGGQGAVVASNILAEAAFMEGKDVCSFPFFGVERRGAPVTAFTRIDSKIIRVKSGIYAPDHVIVMDQSLLKAVDVLAGLKQGGIVLVNAHVKAAALDVKGQYKVAALDATNIAIKHKLGSKAAPIVNSAILGGFAKVSGIVKLDTLVKSIKNNAPSKLEENAAAATDAYDAVEVR
jgi:2-oxoacid:acceptor oxidoreductase gamma subunit (pyruvate/2-ketoisovalerate family)